MLLQYVQMQLEICVFVTVLSVFKKEFVQLKRSMGKKKESNATRSLTSCLSSFHFQMCQGTEKLFLIRF